MKEFCFNMGLTNHPVSDVPHSHPACFKQVNTSLKLAKNHDTINKILLMEKIKKKKKFYQVFGTYFPLNLLE